MPITPADVARSMSQPSALAIIYSPETPPETSSIQVPLSMLNPTPPSAWKPLPLPARLGVDIVYITANEDTSKTPLFMIGGSHNTLLAVLTTDCDPASPGFGSIGDSVDGAAVFKYGAGRAEETKGKLGRALLEALELFIRESLPKIQAEREKEGGMEAAKAEYVRMNPVEFKKCFKAYRAKMAEKWKGKGWETQACPVEIEGEVCGTCGKGKEEEGKALMRCGKCKKMMYCGRACQTEDWKAHKPFCGRV